MFQPVLGLFITQFVFFLVVSRVTVSSEHNLLLILFCRFQ
jgi:hypothetical protein